MPVDVIMPKVDMVMETGTIVRWYRNEHEMVTAGEPILEIETDKANIDVEAPASGVLMAISAKPGDVVPVAQRIAQILMPGETLDLLSQSNSPPVPRLAETHQRQLPVTERASNGAARVRATPAARAISRQYGLSLAEVTGSGPQGRVHKRDVLAILAARQTSLAQTKMAAEQQVATPHVPADEEGELIPLSGTRQIVAKRLMAAASIPTFTLSVEVDMSAISRLRERVPWRPSVTAIIARAVAPLLLKYPDLNSSMRENGIWRHRAVHLGIAMEINERLLVPVIRHAHRLDLQAIQQAIRDLRERAQDRRLGPADLQGSTFSISNLGMFGVDSFTAIINPPEAAILAVGRTVERPIVRNGASLLCPVCVFTLTADHRVVDGALAARFLTDLRAVLEEPYLLL